jgi:hypothetical protein
MFKQGAQTPARPVAKRKNQEKFRDFRSENRSMNGRSPLFLIFALCHGTEKTNCGDLPRRPIGIAFAGRYQTKK